MTISIRKTLLAAVAATCLAPAAEAAEFVLINTDEPGIGFNDPTPAEPVGGNAGTTLGAQRLIAYQRALDLWGSALQSNVPIRVLGSFARLNCNATGGTLAQAGALSIFSDFPNAPLAARWYGAALANAIAGEDLDPEGDDIIANFNGAIGEPDCLAGSSFYYGLDNNPGPQQIDFLDTFMHELAHGLGFQNFANEATGALIQDQADVYMANTRDLNLQKQWDQLTAPEIIASAISTGRVVWTGPNVTINQSRVLGAFEGVRVSGNVNKELSFGTAAFGAPASAATLDGDIVLAVDSDTTADPADACGPLTNDVTGKVVLANRGACGFVVKAANAQAAGAKALVIANNLAGAGAIALGGADPAVTIATIGISLEDGALIRAGLPGVAISYFTDPARRSGAAEGFVRLFAPGVVSLGSSISHFDTVATPNLLMEPSITDTLQSTRNIDLSASLMVDIGWQLQPVTLGRCETSAPGVLANGELVLPVIEDCVADSAGRAGRYASCVAAAGRAWEDDGLLTRRQRISLGNCGLRDALRSSLTR